MLKIYDVLSNLVFRFPVKKKIFIESKNKG
jgi:hypothetical protein